MADNASDIKRLLKYARDRARRQGVPFTLTEADVHIPKVCPALGIPLKRGYGRALPSSPSLDRIVPELGYVPGNVLVVSLRANLIKNNATIGEIAEISRFYYDTALRKFMK